MESIKHLLGILAVILCLVIIIALAWYFLFSLPNRGNIMEGTLVNNQIMTGQMVCL